MSIPTIRCHCFAAAVATLSKPSQRILSAPVLNRRFKTSAQPIQARKDGVMQNGSLSREQRKRNSDVWCYRWWESGPTGRRIHRRIILGTVEQLPDKRAANQATVGLRREINSHDIRTKTTLMTVAELADHFRQRELLDSNMRITYSTKKAYAGYLTKWIVPRWGQNALQHIKAREVELWLASVQRARTTRAKIRNVMSVLFNHARRYDLFDGNPIQWVRQSAKRRSAPNVLTIEEVRHLLAALPPRERILVFLDVSTGLRQSELFGLQWQDIDFEIGELRVTRSVVGQVVGTCKTEASQKAIPLHEDLIEALKGWRQQNPYKEAQHWVFASPSSGGKNPYWGQQLMRRDIRPVAEKLGITKRIGWHTFRTRTPHCFGPWERI
jgi:integrase